MISEGGLTTAVLCGDLNMLRCFAGGAPRKAGVPLRIPTVTVSTDPADLTFASRHVEQTAVIADPASEPERTVHDLVELGRKIGGRPVLYYGTDSMLLCVSRNREALAPHYRFLLPPAERVEEIVDKTRFAKLAAKLGLPAPATLSSREIGSPEEALGRVPLPAVLKPRNHIGWFRSEAIQAEGGRRKKALLAESPEEFFRRYAQMRSFSDDFVVQEYVPGGDDAIMSYHAYLDAQGEPLAHYAGKKIRTYPAGSGESTYLELVYDEDVTRVGLEVVRALGIVGVVKLDFKRDPRTGKLYLLEVNPRFSLWNHLGAASGVNLPLVAYADMTNLPPPRVGPLRTGVRWLAFESDLYAFLHDYGPAGELSLPGWLRSYAGPKIYDVFAWDDPWPAALGLLRRIGTKTRKIGAKAARRAFAAGAP
jgi:predicted ATP-grasp superfamily ATP-dependent carboligase